jgi:hypothetical protein
MIATADHEAAYPLGVLYARRLLDDVEELFRAAEVLACSEEQVGVIARAIANRAREVVTAYEAAMGE